MLFYAKRCYLIFTVTFVEIAWNVIFGAIRSSQKEAVRIQIYGNWFGRFVDRFDPNALHCEQNCSSESSLFYSHFNLWGAVELINFLIIHCAYVFIAITTGCFELNTEYGSNILYIHVCWFKRHVHVYTWTQTVHGHEQFTGFMGGHGHRQ